MRNFAQYSWIIRIDQLGHARRDKNNKIVYVLHIDTEFKLKIMKRSLIIKQSAYDNKSVKHQKQEINL
jgi:hypothetical protein